MHLRPDRRSVLVRDRQPDGEHGVHLQGVRRRRLHAGDRLRDVHHALLLIASSVTSTSATLTLAGHTGNWWYQANAAPDNSCKDAGSGTTQALSGLTSNTSYTYTAYSNSSCSTALASAAVSTYDVTVGNLDKPVYLESCRVSSHTHCAVGFTTGDGIYTLAAITARFKSKTHPQGRYLGDIVVTLHASASNSVGDMKRPADAERATLVGSNPDEAGDYTYTCTAGGGNTCTLAANTTYFIEFAATGGGGTFEGYNWATTESDEENLNPAGNGWSLANGTDFHVDGRAWLAEYADTGLLLVLAHGQQPVGAVREPPV